MLLVRSEREVMTAGWFTAWVLVWVLEDVYAGSAAWGCQAQSAAQRAAMRVVVLGVAAVTRCNCHGLLIVG